jgi:predicted O-methyltransferase YrrM
MKSFINDGADFVSRENVDNFLLATLTFLTDPDYPALEIGVYEGASACYLGEVLTMQNRKAVLLDNLHFLKDQEAQNKFVTDVIEVNLKNAGVEKTHYDIVVADSLTHDWANQKFSYFHIDAHNPGADIKMALKISSDQSIISIDDFLIVPSHLETIIKAIQNEEIFPFAIGTKKIWCTNKKEFAKKIMEDKDFWAPLYELLRIEKFQFFGHEIFKIYNSKKYHEKMYNYYQK